MELSHCAKKPRSCGAGFARLRGGFGVLLREVCEIVDGGALAVVLEVEVVEQRFEGDVAHLRAQHVEDHRAFVHDDGAVVAGVGSEARGLRDGRGVFTHESADGEFVDGFQAGFAAGVLLGVESFGVTREAVADPDIAGGRGKNGVAPPLRRDQTRDGAVGAFGIPDAFAQPQKAGGGEIAQRAVGMAGIKPTFGVVPREPQWPGWLSLTHLGPIAFTVEDCALMLSVMAGPDQGDPMSLPPLGRDLVAAARDRGDLRGMRVAWSEDLGYVRMDDGVRQAFRSALERFGALGAELVPAHPELPNPVDTWNTLTTVDNVVSEGPLLQTGLVGDDARSLIEPGADVSGADYVRVRNAQWEYARTWGRFMEGYDLFLSPAMECVAFEHGHMSPPTIGGEPIGDFYDDYCHFSYPFNLTGQPTMSVPMGSAEHGLPVGLQIVGRRFEDDVVLRAAAAWERENPWPRPSLQARGEIEPDGVLAALADGSGTARLARGEIEAAAGERVANGSDVVEIRRVFSPADEELVVEYERRRGVSS